MWHSGHAYFVNSTPDVNECEGGHNCSDHAQCRNIHGSYQCACLDGYEGDGYNCTGLRICVLLDSRLLQQYLIALLLWSKNHHRITWSFVDYIPLMHLSFIGLYGPCVSIQIRTNVAQKLCFAGQIPPVPM